MPSKAPEAKAQSDNSSKFANAGFGGPDCDTLAPLARMILVLEGIRSCANDKVLSAVKDDSGKVGGEGQSASAQSEVKTGWAPCVLADMQCMFERDWTPDPIRRESARLFGATIIPVNDTKSLTDRSETLRS
ncbi:hypothetical protein [Thalassospira sp. HJ]|uniref:hypothetical protein n=1 Tax=Thalassospira sp. HJ TaxID=1616823 RepID=UPI000A42A1B5|nr:hypothetical protein [Thalassospira sp. HJ]